MLLSCGVSDHIELSHVALVGNGGSIMRVNIGYATDLDRLRLAGMLVMGPPVFMRFFERTWPSEYVMEMLGEYTRSSGS